MIAVEAEEHSRSHGELLDYAFDPCDLDEITAPKGTLPRQQDAGERVLRDVAKGNAQNEPHDARAAEHGRGEAGQARDAQCEVHSNGEDRETCAPCDEIADQIAGAAAAKATAKSKRERPADTVRHDDASEADEE